MIPQAYPLYATTGDHPQIYTVIGWGHEPTRPHVVVLGERGDGRAGFLDPETADIWYWPTWDAARSRGFPGKP